MHLRSSSRLFALYALSGLLWLSILIVLVMGEVVNRPRQGDDPLAPAAASMEAR